jgi:hypothetical protein
VECELISKYLHHVLSAALNLSSLTSRAVSLPLTFA